MTSAEEDFRAALQRLVAGEPTHPELLRRHGTNKLKISYAVVALEAGRSRTLIGHKGCALPRVREEIRTIIERGPSATQARTMLRAAVMRVTSLQQQLAMCHSINAVLQLEVTRLRAELEATRLRPMPGRR